VTAQVAGEVFDIEVSTVEQAVAGVEPEPIQEHYVVVGGRRFPPKQVLAIITGLDRSDFTTHQARSVFRRLGFGVHRRSATPPPAPAVAVGPHGGKEAELLHRYEGRWVAQNGMEVLFDADAVEPVLRWLRRHHRRARVWRIPAGAAAAGSGLSTP
jgi:hypothetical protein